MIGNWHLLPIRAATTGYRNKGRFVVRSTLGLVAALLAAPAFADEPAQQTEREPCLNPSSSYAARWLEGHDVWAQNQLGKDRKPVRVSTTCIGLRNADFIRFAAVSRCLDKGDDVVATNIDGRRQRCLVTNVTAYVPPASEAKPD
jgi:hypothetical protein